MTPAIRNSVNNPSWCASCNHYTNPGEFHPNHGKGYPPGVRLQVENMRISLEFRKGTFSSPGPRTELSHVRWKRPSGSKSLFPHLKSAPTFNCRSRRDFLASAEITLLAHTAETSRVILRANPLRRANIVLITHQPVATLAVKREVAALFWTGDTSAVELSGNISGNRDSNN